MDDDDIIERILDELDDDYKELVRAVQARDNPRSFDELHEKLLTFEASLQNNKKLSSPVGFSVWLKLATAAAHQLASSLSWKHKLALVFFSSK